MPTASSAMQMEDTMEIDLNGYLMTPTIDEEDHLFGWKVHSINFPVMSKLAHKFLCIPASEGLLVQGET